MLAQRHMQTVVLSWNPSYESVNNAAEDKKKSNNFITSGFICRIQFAQETWDQV